MTIIAPVDGDDLDPAWAGLITDAVNEAVIDLAAFQGITDYSSSFVLGSSGTQPTKGLSTYQASYSQVGRKIYYSWAIEIGAGFVAGTGTYRIPLPVTSANSNREVGTVYVADQGTALLIGACVFATTVDQYLSIVLANATGAFLGAAGPGTAWAATDLIQGSIMYLGPP